MTVGLPNGAFVTSSRSFLRNQKDIPGEKKYTHIKKKIFSSFFSDWVVVCGKKSNCDIILGERDEKNSPRMKQKIHVFTVFMISSLLSPAYHMASWHPSAPLPIACMAMATTSRSPIDPHGTKKIFRRINNSQPPQILSNHRNFALAPLYNWQSIHVWAVKTCWATFIWKRSPQTPGLLKGIECLKNCQSWQGKSTQEVSDPKTLLNKSLFFFAASEYCIFFPEILRASCFLFL